MFLDRCLGCRMWNAGGFGDKFKWSRVGEGLVLGGLLGIFGLIIVAFFKPITTPLQRPTTSGMPLPAPGWYQDGPRGLRWRNGSAWTDASPPPSLPPS